MYVDVHQAANLKASDSNGKADPFVEVVYGGKKYKTKAKEKTLSPLWEERAEFAYVSGATLQLRVVDKDTFNNDFMGLVVVDDLRDEKYGDKERSPKWTSLADKKNRKPEDKSRGKIQYTVRVLTSDPGKASKASSSSSSKKGKKSKKRKSKSKSGKKKKKKSLDDDDNNDSSLSSEDSPVVRPEDRFFGADSDSSMENTDDILQAIDKANLDPDAEEDLLVKVAEKRVQRLVDKAELRAAYGPPPSRLDNMGLAHGLNDPRSIALDPHAGGRPRHPRHRHPPPPRPIAAMASRHRRDMADFQAHRTSAARLAMAGERDRYGQPLLVGAFGSIHDPLNPSGVIRSRNSPRGRRVSGPPLDSNGYLVPASDLVSKYAGDYVNQSGAAYAGGYGSASRRHSSSSTRHSTTRRRRFLKINPDNPDAESPEVGDFVYRIIE